MYLVRWYDVDVFYCFELFVCYGIVDGWMVGVDGVGEFFVY